MFKVILKNKYGEQIEMKLKKTDKNVKHFETLKPKEGSIFKLGVRERNKEVIFP